MKAARIAIVAVVAVAAGVFAWWRLRGGGECQRFADRVCATVPASCSDVKVAFEGGGGFSAGHCREGNQLLDKADGQPEGLRIALTSAAFAETIGAEDLFRANRETMMMLMDVDLALDQGRAPPDDLIKRIRGLGPPTCNILIGRLSAPDPKRRDLAHGLLVDVRGQDLGTDAAAWRSWCREVFKASLKPK
jgi:hypothetical protein